jgi:hypothetical protein
MNKHPWTAEKIVLWTRFSIGSLTMTDPTARYHLARAIRAGRRALQASWRLRNYKGPYRIFI